MTHAPFSIADPRKQIPFSHFLRKPCTIAGLASISAWLPISHTASIRPAVKSDSCS